MISITGMAPGERPTVDEWRAKGQFKDLLDHRIFFVDTATEQPPLLLIHGFPTSSWDWVDVWPMLSEDYRLIAPDLLGFGLSAKPRGHRYTIREQADLVQAVVHHLRLDSFHVLCHDYGDTVGQELLARQNAGAGAGRWRTVCFLNGGLLAEAHRARPIQRLLASSLGPYLVPFMSRGTFDANMKRVFGPNTQPSPELLDSMWTLLNVSNGKRAIPDLLSYIRERREQRSRWVGAIQHSRVPVGIINGPADPVSGAHMVERLKEVVDQPLFIETLPDIGHYPQCEAPQAVVEAWRRFVSSTESEA